MRRHTKGLVLLVTLGVLLWPSCVGDSKLDYSLQNKYNESSNLDVVHIPGNWPFNYVTKGGAFIAN